MTSRPSVPRSGRRSTDQATRDLILRLYAEGIPVRDVAQKAKVGNGTIYRVLDAAGAPRRPR